MKWKVSLSKNAEKQLSKLSEKLQSTLYFLREDLQWNGPTLEKWPNYGKLHGKKSIDKRHCHLQKGRPTYVCCWEVIDKRNKIIEVYYVGSHEKAPY